MKRMIYLFVIGALVCLTSCEKVLPPSLKALTIVDVTESAIVCTCELEEGTVADATFYYGTSKNSVANMKSSKAAATIDGMVIRGEITGLNPNTTYYIMGCGINEKGQGVTKVVSVRTASSTPQPSDNPSPGTTDK